METADIANGKILKKMQKRNKIQEKVKIISIIICLVRRAILCSSPSSTLVTTIEWMLVYLAS